MEVKLIDKKNIALSHSQTPTSAHHDRLLTYKNLYDNQTHCTGYHSLLLVKYTAKHHSHKTTDSVPSESNVFYNRKLIRSRHCWCMSITHVFPANSRIYCYAQCHPCFEGIHTKMRPLLSVNSPSYI